MILVMAYQTKIHEYITARQKAIRIFFVIFYTVGVIGMALPFTFPLFLILIPFALILSFIALVMYHESKIDWKTITVFLSIYIISFTVEAIGVNIGQVFGYYHYGNGLGLKIFETPLIIGVNWLFLVYTTAAVVEKFRLHIVFKIILASLSMLLYDIVLEQVAPKIDMWHWKNDSIPLQNYLSWFAMALFFHSLLKILNIQIKNRLALLILGCQFFFFFLLLIFLS